MGKKSYLSENSNSNIEGFFSLMGKILMTSALIVIAFTAIRLMAFSDMTTGMKIMYLFQSMMLVFLSFIAFLFVLFSMQNYMFEIFPDSAIYRFFVAFVICFSIVTILSVSIIQSILASP